MAECVADEAGGAGGSKAATEARVAKAARDTAAGPVVDHTAARSAADVAAGLNRKNFTFTSEILASQGPVYFYLSDLETLVSHPKNCLIYVTKIYPYVFYYSHHYWFCGKANLITIQFASRT